MDFPLITPFAAWQNSAGVVMARIYGLAGTAITQATITSISWSVGTIDGVGDDAEYTAVVAEASLTVADVISDTLLTSLPWTKDSIGRNFTHIIPKTAFPDAHARYRIEYSFVPSTGSTYAFKIVLEGKVNEIFGIAA